jgi:hypothetical protein
MFEIKRYTPQDKTIWDQYVSKARNATFLFYRDYMDYHSNRFHDYSLMFFKNGRLHSLLPAHSSDDTFFSHLGLTYGGLIMDINVTIAETCQLFECLNNYLRLKGFRHVQYKAIPWIYHQVPSEEDLYALFWKCGAKLSTRNVGTTIFIQQNLKWRRNHLRQLKKAYLNGITVQRGADIAEFWPVLEQHLLQRYQSKPVHSLAEMQLLQSRFPNNIIQYNAYKEGHIVGGITIYLSHNVVHAQYSSGNAEGMALGAMEIIYDKIMHEDYPNYAYLDLGSSTEQECSVINEGLISFKEGYGGRAVVYDTYEWTL